MTRHIMKKTPDVIIIGSKKSGTRALIKFLNLHPKVRISRPEIHFFDKHYERGLSWYVSQLPSVIPNSGEINAEKTPAYFHSPLVPQRVAEMDPNVKLLLIVRDPVKRLISEYNQHKYQHMTDSSNTKFPEFEEYLFLDGNQLNIAKQSLQISIYHQHMFHWLKHFPLEQIHLVDGEKMSQKPWQELQKIEAFLNLSPFITQDNFYFNKTKGFYCAKYVQSSGEWTCTKKGCLDDRKGRPPPNVKEETLATLRHFFKPHNELFFKLINRTFEWEMG